MGTKNRERRAAKQKARDRRRGRDSAPTSGGEPFTNVFAEAFSPPRLTADAVVVMLGQAIMADTEGDREALERCRHELAHPDSADADAVRRGLELALVHLSEQYWHHGWLPVDLVEHLVRTLPAAQAELACDAVALQIQRYAAASLHPRWWQSVLRAGVGPDRAPQRPVPGAWAERHGMSPDATVGAVLAVLTAANAFPLLPTIVPPPESGPARRAARTASAYDGVDARVLARVRALLAKAESTPYPEEAEALSAKAQELMNRHALEQAVLEGEDTEQVAITIRLWLDAPYVAAKGMLVSQVADANRCRSIRSSGLDMVSVVGHASDLDAVELLVTSLLVQASRAMLHEGRTTASGSRARSRSFRQSFLIAYAGRVGERLRSAATAAQEEVADDERLLPVLARRASAVDDAVAETFGELNTQSIAINDAAGWHAGRAAAETASLTLDRDRVER